MPLQHVLKVHRLDSLRLCSLIILRRHQKLSAIDFRMSSIFSVAVLGITVALTVKILNDLDYHKVIYNHTPGKCQYIQGIERGSEDMVLLSNGLALISSGLYLPMLGKSQKPGNIYVVDPSSDNPKAENLVIKSDQTWKPEEFFPLGMTTWEEKGSITVYVINSLTHAIHIFDLKLNEKQLVLKQTVSHPSFSNPNSLIAIGRDQFFLTNFAYFNHYIGHMAEIVLKLPFGGVWFYNGAEFVQVLSGLQGPNGISVSSSKKYLYLATVMEKRLSVYGIKSASDRNLSLIQTIDLHTSGDNVKVDSRGSVWIGAHAIAYKIFAALLDRNNYAPSQVLKITFNNDHSKWQIEEAYADDGRQLSGSSVGLASADGKKLLIGTVMSKAMICEIAQ